MTKEYRKYCEERVEAAKDALSIVATSKLLSNKKKKEWLNVARRQLANYSKELK